MAFLHNSMVNTSSLNSLRLTFNHRNIRTTENKLCFVSETCGHPVFQISSNPLEALMLMLPRRSGGLVPNACELTLGRDADTQSRSDRRHGKARRSVSKLKTSLCSSSSCLDKVLLLTRPGLDPFHYSSLQHYHLSQGDLHAPPFRYGISASYGVSSHSCWSNTPEGCMPCMENLALCWI